MLAEEAREEDVTRMPSGYDDERHPTTGQGA